MELMGLSPKRKRIRQQNTFPHYQDRNDFPGPLPSILTTRAIPGTYLTLDRGGFREQKTAPKVQNLFPLVKVVCRPTPRTPLRESLVSNSELSNSE